LRFSAYLVARHLLPDHPTARGVVAADLVRDTVEVLRAGGWGAKGAELDLAGDVHVRVRDAIARENRAQA
jgi:hypothetical protein